MPRHSQSTLRIFRVHGLAVAAWPGRFREVPPWFSTNYMHADAVRSLSGKLVDVGEDACERLGRADSSANGRANPPPTVTSRAAMKDPAAARSKARRNPRPGTLRKRSRNEGPRRSSSRPPSLARTIGWDTRSGSSSGSGRLLAAFLIVHKSVSRYLAHSHYKKWSQSPVGMRGNQVFVDFDMRLDVYISRDSVDILNSIPSAVLNSDTLDGYSSIEKLFGCTRTSIRSERLTPDEAVHKIHVELFIDWVDSLTHRFIQCKPKERMAVSLTCELLFHRPAEERGFVLREFRARGVHH